MFQAINLGFLKIIQDIISILTFVKTYLCLIELIFMEEKC